MLLNDIGLSHTFNEGVLRQKATAIWFTGLSGAGKTTLALAMHRRLAENNFFSVILDGDDLRQGINAELGFTPADRSENIRRTAELTRLLINNGIISIVSTISPYPALRANARKIIGPHSFIEIYVNASLAVCEERDVKGFYQKARKNQVSDFTGVHDQYIPPDNPDLVIPTDCWSVGESVEKIYSFVRQKITHTGMAAILPASL